MKIITIYSSKGGTTKTTTIANLAGLLADIGYKVLMIDADHTQPSLSSYYPLNKKAPCGLVELIKTREISDKVISQTSLPRLDLIYADDSQNELSVFLRETAAGIFRFNSIINKLKENESINYDFVLIDTRGAIGLLPDAAMIAADIIISPIPPDVLSATEFNRGTVNRYQRINDDIGDIKRTLSPMFVFLSRVERSSDSNALSEVIQAQIKPLENFYFLPVQIPASAAYKSATSAQTPIHQFDKKIYASIPNGHAAMTGFWTAICDQHNKLNPEDVIGGASA